MVNPSEENKAVRKNEGSDKNGVGIGEICYFKDGDQMRERKRGSEKETDKDSEKKERPSEKTLILVGYGGCQTQIQDTLRGQVSPVLNLALA